MARLLADGFHILHSGMIHEGLIVAPTYGRAARDANDVFFAEIVPAGTIWLPWPDRTSRWWYEVKAFRSLDGSGTLAPIDVTSPDGYWTETMAYQPHGSGGAFTLRACIRRATEAVDHFAELGQLFEMHRTFE